MDEKQQDNLSEQHLIPAGEILVGQIHSEVFRQDRMCILFANIL